MLDPIVQTPGQIVLKPRCRGKIGLQRCAGMTERKFWLRNTFVNVSQMSAFVSFASPPPVLPPPEISALEGTIPVLVIKPPLSDPHLPVSLTRQLKRMPELSEMVTKLA